eukprot:COSAG04_NODE_2208_length_4527_cov_1.984643_4_plen_216_part_00
MQDAAREEGLRHQLSLLEDGRLRAAEERQALTPRPDWRALAAPPPARPAAEPEPEDEAVGMEPEELAARAEAQPPPEPEPEPEPEQEQEEGAGAHEGESQRRVRALHAAMQEAQASQHRTEQQLAVARGAVEAMGVAWEAFMERGVEALPLPKKAKKKAAKRAQKIAAAAAAAAAAAEEEQVDGTTRAHAEGVLESADAPAVSPSLHLLIVSRLC